MSRRVRGYHGTNFLTADAIVNRRLTFEATIGPEAWLGRGVYFWEENLALGIQWARRRCERLARESGQIDVPAVIVADIDLSHCMDLCQAEWAEAVQDMAAQTTVIPPQHGPVFWTANGSRNEISDFATAFAPGDNFADCFVIDALHAHATQARLITTKRAAFHGEVQLYSNSYFFNQTHVQIAVTDYAAMNVRCDLILPPAGVP